MKIKYLLLSICLLASVAYYAKPLVSNIFAPFSLKAIPESLLAHFFETKTAVDAHDTQIEILTSEDKQ